MSVSFFILDFDLLSCKLGGFTFKGLLRNRLTEVGGHNFQKASLI